MTDYLLILSVGPVQSMIAAARRSRDLWSGSALLSELAKATALSLMEQGAELIFPAVKDKSQLQHNTELSVGNKIQALISADHQQQVRQIIENTKQATHQRFINEADNAKQALKNLQDIRVDIWQAQVNDYVEIQAAWAVVSEKQNYKQAAELASQVLAARKATRDFHQSIANVDKATCVTSPYNTQFMLPKSSLDGAKETVLYEDKHKKLSSSTRRQLGLSKSEQLDSLGIIKRLGLKKQAEQFTPFTRVAAQAWLENIAQNEQSKQHLLQINQVYKQLVELNLATNVTGNKGIYQDLPFDGQLLYESRLDALIAEYKFDAEIVEALDLFKQAIKPLWRTYGQPCPYGILLLADGDRMGALLDKATKQEEHQEITVALSSFAGNVANIMRKYMGHCIYAGGDDVLGFVPLHTAYHCAKDLSESFKNSLSAVASKLKAEDAPTLSVGLAIAHVMTPLGIIRELAQQAEKYAKGDHIEDHNQRRNALGICLDIRSGNTTKLRLSWSDENAHQQFNEWIQFYVNKNIPSRIAYDTRAIDLRTQNISKNEALQKGIRTAEFSRMLKKARLTKGGNVEAEHQRKLTERAEEIGLQVLSDELIVARWFAAKTQRDLGKV